MKKTGKKSNPNHPRGKNNPDGERNDPPPIDWAEYDKGRRAEGRPYTERMREVADKVRHIMDKPFGKLDWEVSDILAALVKSEKLSYWGLVKHFDKHPWTWSGASCTGRTAV